ncbi:MAG: histidine kinase dimerization/phospho-acceptor domain-containing protein [Eubacteriales bacterium]|nr:histidine kinase dimerization/phospho-acceptor domain-containing protein [Eubacteriales bacterium]
MSAKMPEAGQPNSITSKLNHNLLRRLLVSFLRLDIFYILAVFVTFIAYHETKNQAWSFGLAWPLFTWGPARDFSSFYERLNSLTYTLKLDHGDSRIIEAGSFFQLAYIIGLALLVVELILLLKQYQLGKKRNNEILEAPLRFLEDQTDIMRRIQQQQAKFHDLESAIENVQPAAPEARIDMGDADLQGIEDALNNLLAETHATYQQQIRFVSDASHELRTPISVIQGYADLLARWGTEDEEVLHESIEAIQTEAQQMQTLVEQLLFLARGDAGRHNLELETVDLSELVSDVQAEYAMIDTGHNWTLDISGPVLARGDKKMLKQLLRILSDNAKRYSDPGQPIRLCGGYEADGSPFVFVQDQGTGIASADLPKIFDRFYRSDPARHRESGGTGLGLSIAKWIASRHGGYFRVLSREGLGTRFTLVLPALPAGAEAADKSSTGEQEHPVEQGATKRESEDE